MTEDRFAGNDDILIAPSVRQRYLPWTRSNNQPKPRCRMCDRPVSEVGKRCPSCASKANAAQAVATRKANKAAKESP